jgi:hypothetical protein
MDKLDLKRLIADSNFEDNTANIRKLKHSGLMRKDIQKILQLKSKHVRLIRNDFDGFTKLCSSQCNFLFSHYTDIFNRVLKDELDLSILGSVIDILSKIEDGEVDQMKGSTEVGELLKKMYIDSALKTGDKINSNHQDTNKEHVFHESKTLSWREFKALNNN